MKGDKTENVDATLARVEPNKDYSDLSIEEISLGKLKVKGIKLRLKVIIVLALIALCTAILRHLIDKSFF